MHAAPDAHALGAAGRVFPVKYGPVKYGNTICESTSDTGRHLRGSYDARQEALQAHLFGAKFTKVAPFAAPAAHSIAAELYEHQASRHVEPSEESRLVFKVRPGTRAVSLELCMSSAFVLTG